MKKVINEVKRMQKLAGIVNEVSTKKNYPKEITDLIDTLISTMGYKKYQLTINNLYGRYVIELPTTGFSVPQLRKLGSMLGDEMGVGYAPYTNHNGMIIRTNIQVQ
jgi:hypothetical protein